MYIYMYVNELYNKKKIFIKICHSVLSIRVSNVHCCILPPNPYISHNVHQLLKVY